MLLGPLAYEWWSGDLFNSGIDPSITPGPTEWSTGGAEFPDFLEDVLNNGGGDHFDVMSFHSYVVFHPRWDLPDDGSLPGDVAYEPACSGSTDLLKRPQEGDILGKLIYLRKRLMKHNPAYGNKPLVSRCCSKAVWGGTCLGAMSSRVGMPCREMCGLWLLD